MTNILRTSGLSHHGSNRRQFLRIGALGLGGLTLSDVFRLQAQGKTAAPATKKSIIMLYLPGGPSHIDMYDPKPDAPVEFRGEFDSIQTKVPGLIFSEYMPLQAQIADKFSVIQGIKFRGRHDAYELLSGFPSQRSGEIRGNEKWPVFGSIVSRIRSEQAGQSLAMPPYVNLNDLRLGLESDDPEVPRYMGRQHAPFRPTGPGPRICVFRSRFLPSAWKSRKLLLAQFDQTRRKAEASGEMRALDEFQRRAVDMVTSGAVYKALDLNQEEVRVRERFEGCTNLLIARRLVEAGVSVVTVAQGGIQKAAWPSCARHLGYPHE